MIKKYLWLISICFHLNSCHYCPSLHSVLSSTQWPVSFHPRWRQVLSTNICSTSTSTCKALRAHGRQYGLRPAKPPMERACTHVGCSSFPRCLLSRPQFPDLIVFSELISERTKVVGHQFEVNTFTLDWATLKICYLLVETWKKTLKNLKKVGWFFYNCLTCRLEMALYSSIQKNLGELSKICQTQAP